MAINTTPREKPTGGGNPTAGAINDLNFPSSELNDQAISTQRASYALKGHTLNSTDHQDEPVMYWAERWGLVRCLPTLHDVVLFLAQIGGRV